MVPPVTIQKVIHIQSSHARLMLRYSSSLFINLYPRDLEGTHAVSPHDCITYVYPAVDTSRPHSLTYHVYPLDLHSLDSEEMHVAPS
jgi:hypothetical protein